MPPPNFAAVRAWSAGHPAMVAASSLFLVMLARHAPGMVAIGRATDQGAALPLHRNLDLWLSYYRRHRHIGADLRFAGSLAPDLSAVVAGFEQLVADVQALPDDLDDVHDPRVESCGQQMLGLFFSTFGVETDVTPFQSSDISDPRFLALWFFICVSIPSMMLFQSPPQRLLRRARDGDLVALGKLILLDRNVLFDPFVKRVITADPEGWKVVRSNLSGRLPAIKRARWKVMAAGTLRVIAEKSRYQLTHHAIADLFHAFARDCDGALEDPDLGPRQLRTFERRVGLAPSGLIRGIVVSWDRRVRIAARTWKRWTF